MVFKKKSYLKHFYNKIARCYYIVHNVYTYNCIQFDCIYIAVQNHLVLSI